MVDRLGFVKTIEAVLAAIIAFSAYNFIQTINSNQARIIERTPSIEINDFLDTINLYDIANNYDYLKLDSLFNNLFFKSIYYYFEPVYYDKFTINKTNSNISFTYNFPVGIDENSIKIINNNNELSRYASFSWYKVPIAFNDSLNNDYVEINLSLKIDNINNRSFMFFVNNKKSIISLTKWDKSNLTNVSLIAYVPEIDSSKLGYVYFSTDNYTNINYPSLNITKQVNLTIYNTIKARTADIAFTPLPNITTYFIRYSLFTTSINDYIRINNINNTNLYIDINTSLKKGTNPRTTSIKGKTFVRKIIPRKEGFTELRVYGDYS